MSRHLVTNSAAARHWLEHYGYLSEEQNDVRQALQELQRRHLLPATGTASPRSLALMSQPRCGVSDHRIAADCRWQKNRLTYFHEPGFNLFKATLGSAGRALSRQVIDEGFAAWAAITHFTFQRIDTPDADIWIGGGRGRRYGFDGPGHTLAWAHMPCGEWEGPLESRFDNDERWVYERKLAKGPAIWALPVWIHELGHLLGLDHSRSRNDIMFAFYDPKVWLPQSGDRRRVRSLYGLAA